MALLGKPVVIAGGSGFIGVSLTAHLAARGTPVVILSRNPPTCRGEWRYVAWDARTIGDWTTALDGARAVVNLVGRSVDCVKTPAHQDEILRSRVEATLLLGRAMRLLRSPPPLWVQMSTAHIYGDPPSAVCDEFSPLGFGFAPQVGRAWEEAFAGAKLPAQRGVVVRTSFVIGRDRGSGSGALGRLQAITRLGFGGRVGSGRQGMSWIHETDMNRIIERAINDETMHGTYVATSPNPVSQIEFMRSLRRAMRVPIGLPAAEWMVRLGATLLLRSDPELALYGRYVVPTRLCNEGFAFEYPTLDAALADLLRAGVRT